MQRTAGTNAAGAGRAAAAAARARRRVLLLQLHTLVLRRVHARAEGVLRVLGLHNREGESVSEGGATKTTELSHGGDPLSSPEKTPLAVQLRRLTL